MTFNELYSKMLEILPGAEIVQDNDGQLVVYTGLREPVVLGGVAFGGDDAQLVEMEDA